MSKIIFIEPKQQGEHIFSQFALPRIGIFILGTMMKERGWDVEVIVEDMEEFEPEDVSDADIVGISTITPTAGKAYQIADIVKKLGITVIMGGPHVTFLPDEAMEHSDFVVRSEGEIALMKLIDAIEGDGDYSGVPNLSYRNKQGSILHNPVLPFERDLDRYPVCDFSLLKNNKSLKIMPVQTSRGCPYDCSFCSVTGMFGKKYRYRSTEHILKELRGYRDLGKMIFFYDDHFAANKKRAKELLRAMIDEGMTFKWSTQVRVELAHDIELIELMKEAGCHTLFLGFESVNPESLKEMKKKQTVEDIERAIRTINRYGIHIHGMFVYGFDNDTPATVKETIKFAQRLNLTSAQFLILTPFPGSEFYREVEQRIFIDDWTLFDTHHVTFTPKNFTVYELQRAQTYSHERFYSFPQMIKKLFLRRWIGVGIALFARRHNWWWKRHNKEYVRLLKSMSKKGWNGPPADRGPRVMAPKPNL